MTSTKPPAGHPVPRPSSNSRGVAADVGRDDLGHRDLGLADEPEEELEPARGRRRGGGGGRRPCRRACRRPGTRPRGARSRRRSAARSGGRSRRSRPRRRPCRRRRGRSGRCRSGSGRGSRRTPKR
ncbi:MAG: hypothetical protein MZV64_33660 [Ignavibacteriales bacterium]|nr:hypothetical protein [Ignavibacteriales bacterium]